ncbi:MAG: hypothetical protein AB4372_08745, partial [Xenococcus sp. (in: cyanobacteria)]
MQENPFTKDVPIVTQLKTNDTDELAEFVPGWDQEHIQLTKGIFEWETCIIEIGGFQFSEEFYGAPALFRGSAPPETFVIGIPKRCLAEFEFLYGGNIVTKDCCLTGNFRQYLDLKTSNETSLLLVTAPIASIFTQAEIMKLPLTREQLLSPGIITPDPTAMRQLSDYLEELLLLAKSHPDRLTDISQGNSMDNLILEDSLPLVLD